MVSDDGPRQGLFAFRDTELFHYFQDTAELDHVMWFDELGLPSDGPEYDALLRGKVIFDEDADRIIVGYYGAACLSNHHYRRLVDVFALDESMIIEKMLHEPY